VVLNGRIDQEGDFKRPKKALFVGADYSDPRSLNDPNFDHRVYEDYLEDEILRKVEDFKRKFLEMKAKAEESEREVALSEIKVEEIIKKTKELEAKKQGFKDELFQETKKQAELKQRLTDLEDDKLTLEQQLETGFKLGKGTQVKDVNLAKHK
jgi:chromosome segregation ATPase